MDEFEYTCSCCGEVHQGVPDLAFDVPYSYHVLDTEGRSRARLDADVCSIDDHRFVRGVLEIPVHGQEVCFAYGVWVSLSQANFEKYLELFEATDPKQDAPWFGWLNNRFAGYPDTLSLKTNVHLRPHPSRPRIELQSTDHPLAIEQREGISRTRLQQILESVEHPPSAA
jgi:hypothetical protein